MTDKITGIVELKKAIVELEDRHFHPSYHKAFKETLKLISEFEASVKDNNFTEDELKLLEGWTVGYLYASQELSNEDYKKLTAVVEKCKKLRRILEGENIHV